MRERLPLPRKIANAPELNFGLELYYDAFWDLSTCRMSGYSLGPIPWGSVNDYASTFEFDDEQRHALHYYIRVMDNVYVKFHSPKKGKKWQRQGASGSSKNGWGG